MMNDDSEQAIITEACLIDEQTQRNQGNTSMERLGALMERSLEGAYRAHDEQLHDGQEPWRGSQVKPS